MCSSSRANVKLVGGEHHEGVKDGDAMAGFVQRYAKTDNTIAFGGIRRFVHVPDATCTYMRAKNDCLIKDSYE